MKKIKLIKKLACLTLIGGGILTTLPFGISSCGCSSKINITKVTVSDDNMLYGDVYTPSEQYGFIEVTSSVNKQHNYFYELEDVDYRIQDSIDIQYVENEQYFIKWDSIPQAGAYTFKVKVSLSDDPSIYCYSDLITLKIDFQLTEIILTDNNYDFVGTNGYEGFQNGFDGNLVIGNSVTNIKNNAFYKCSSLTGSLTIPDSVVEIGHNAFMGCEGLSGTITIGSGLTAIPDYFVCGNINITTISFPSNVTSIGNSSFYECTSLSGTLVIPSSIQSVGGSAFKNCSNLTGITFDGFTSAPQGWYNIKNIFEGWKNTGTNFVKTINGWNSTDALAFAQSYSLPTNGSWIAG